MGVVYGTRGEALWLGGTRLMFELQEYLAEITGMDALSLAPMAGAQGDLANILMIKAYFQA